MPFGQSLANDELTQSGFELEIMPLDAARSEGHRHLTPREEGNLARLGLLRRTCWLASRAVIKRLGCRLAPTVVPPDFIETARACDPRPCCILPNGMRFSVSVSHDDAYVFAALAPQSVPLGVAIEPVGDASAGMARRHFPAWPDNAEDVTRLWSACKAVVSCSRLGLPRLLGSALPVRRGTGGLLLDVPDTGIFWIHQTLFDNRVFSLTTSSTT